MKKIVYDLDGTLIKFNTFKLWIFLSWIYPLLTLKLGALSKVSLLILLRILRKKSRVDFKSNLLILQSGNLYWDRLGYRYAVFLCNYCIRKDLVEFKGKGDSACLATAAPNIYVFPLAMKLKLFDCVLCTQVSNSGEMVEVFSSMKKDMVLNSFSKKPDLFYTDHSDDIPLAEVCKKTYFVNSTKSSKYKILECAKIDNYEFIS